MKRNKNFQLKLLEMGFEFKIVNRLLEITNEYSISQLVQMLSMENGFYLHNFYKNDKDNNYICYICQEPESRHLKLPKFKLPYEIVYFNKEAETIVFDEEDEDLIHEPSVLWENSLILHSNQIALDITFENHSMKMLFFFFIFVIIIILAIVINKNDIFFRSHTKCISIKFCI